ncbi:MAG TPA: peptidylprolyl isomerase [Verrucomicrobiae bacterium]|nr:peptidylprolyl isomerase [Verrucomicrobiae bacterium]
MMRAMRPFPFSKTVRQLLPMTLCASGLLLLSGPARAVTLTLWTNNIVMPENRTFQMPITASDPDGQPLRFAVATSNKKLTGAFASRSNPSMVINVSGVDSDNNPFTGDLVAQLFEDLAPTTTARIVTLVNSNFYDGLLFQRVISNSMAQCGGSTNDPNLESGTTIDDEYVASLIYDGFGQLGMANQASATSQGVHDSNDSQFFITDVDLSVTKSNASSPEDLNFEKPIFGQLTSGFDVLAKIMSTAVGPNPNDTNEMSAPLSNVVMNSVIIITNSQDAVLRLTAAPKFLGNVTVTVSATNAENQVATQTFQVSVVTDSNTSAAFLGPVPSSITVTQNVAATFVLTSTDVDGLAVQYGLEDVDTFAFPTNMYITLNPKTKLLSFSPDLTLTGVVDMIVGATDNIHSYDTQRFTLTFVPWSATPTMTIVPLKGSMVDSAKPLGDRINVSGTFSFNGGSDGAFTSNDVLELTLGDPSSPLAIQIPANTLETKFSKGTYTTKARGIVSGFSSNVTVSAQMSIAKGTFQISVSSFDFPVALTNQMLEVGIALGNNYGSNVETWVQSKPGTFVPPPAR